MNIFHLHDDPVTCATYHCDKHVVKMILEYAQLLCTAHRILDGNGNPEFHDQLYRATHKNHPCAIWARSSSVNYYYLYDMFVALGNEYTHRYGKIHLTITKLKHLLRQLPDMIPYEKANHHYPLPLCMPDECKLSNSIDSYRNYYRYKKSIIDMRWTNREVPAWFTQEINDRLG